MGLQRGHDWATEHACIYYSTWDFPGDISGKNLPANSGGLRDVNSITLKGLGRSSGGGHENPLQYSSLENPMGREAWQSSVHGSMESQRVRHDWRDLACACTHTHTHTLLYIIFIRFWSKCISINDCKASTLFYFWKPTESLLWTFYFVGWNT